MTFLWYYHFITPFQVKVKKNVLQLPPLLSLNSNEEVIEGKRLVNDSVVVEYGHAE